MSHSVIAARGAPQPLPLRAHGEEVKAAVGKILAARMRSPGRGERRRDSRVPFPYLTRLTPVEDDGFSPSGPSIVVVGKHLSMGGFNFYHRDPLPHRRMIAWIEGDSGHLTTLLLELLWCRFNRQGWYENGGRFLRVLAAPPRVDGERMAS